MAHSDDEATSYSGPLGERLARIEAKVKHQHSQHSELKRDFEKFVEDLEEEKRKLEDEKRSEARARAEWLRSMGAKILVAFVGSQAASFFLIKAFS